MIVRTFVPALVVALPLIVDAQAPRARWSNPEPSNTEAPAIRVWIPGAWSLGFGTPVAVSFEVSEAAHVAVFRIDGDGDLTVLWPQRSSLQTAARAGREYRVTGPRSNQYAFAADHEIGNGMVLAIASPDPIDLSGFRSYRNDVTYHRYDHLRRRYLGGVKSVVNRITQEILYAVDSPYDYDIAFYTVAGNRFFAASAYCDANYAHFAGARYPRGYSSWVGGYFYGDWNDCYGNTLYSSYLAYCSAWHAFSYTSYSWCRFGNPFWPSSPGPIAGGPQPEQPRANTDMIDTIMSRPVDVYPVIDRKADQATGGTTHVITMEPVRDAPNGTRWLPDDDTEAVSLPARFRRDRADEGRRTGPINTRDEGFTRGPGGGLRVDDRPGPSPGSAFMPPVREAPRPLVWRDHARDADRGTSHTAPQRWERPTTYQGPQSPSHSGGDSRIDRGHTSSGSSSPSAGATMTPRTDASVTRTEGATSKASDAKSSGERKPQQ